MQREFMVSDTYSKFNTEHTYEAALKVISEIINKEPEYDFDYENGDYLQILEVTNNGEKITRKVLDLWHFDQVKNTWNKTDISKLPIVYLITESEDKKSPFFFELNLGFLVQKEEQNIYFLTKDGLNHRIEIKDLSKPTRLVRAIQKTHVVLDPSTVERVLEAIWIDRQIRLNEILNRIKAIIMDLENDPYKFFNYASVSQNLFAKYAKKHYDSDTTVLGFTVKVGVYNLSMKFIKMKVESIDSKNLRVSRRIGRNNIPEAYESNEIEIPKDFQSKGIVTLRDFDNPEVQTFHILVNRKNIVNTESSKVVFKNSVQELLIQLYAIYNHISSIESIIRTSFSYGYILENEPSYIV